ncbi:MAG: (deoxy)nucleoside triphosphate pyrophosphohydrolase [Cellulosilyticum sp.]|nr:(deoxy)nucleoside triphosphate pyrophosphohydrolase [Cellulosilyticum sp.]
MGKKAMKELEVVAAIIIYKDQILCMQRNKGKYDYVSYKYEFPGGKIELGETRAQALQRELREEMALEVAIRDEDFYMTVEHVYPDFKITMHSFICHVTSQVFVRKEHVDHKLMTKDELMSLDWAPADIPIVKRLQEDSECI